MSLFGSVFLLGYATPPAGLVHWPEDATEGMGDGVVMQYQVMGSNNPNPLEVGGEIVDVRGRTLTHEVGHYLGLRHIWGDGDCSEEDGVDDTPNAAAQSNQDCDTLKNSCVDAIGLLGDLPDMVENYMDYSAETCQNSFTFGQIDIMRSVIEIQRKTLIEDNPALKITQEQPALKVEIYPNPSQGEITIKNNESEQTHIRIFTETGQLVYTAVMAPHTSLVHPNLAKGFYLVNLLNKNTVSVQKLIVY